MMGAGHDRRTASLSFRGFDRGEKTGDVYRPPSTCLTRASRKHHALAAVPRDSAIVVSSSIRCGSGRNDHEVAQALVPASDDASELTAFIDVDVGREYTETWWSKVNSAVDLASG